MVLQKMHVLKCRCTFSTLETTKVHLKLQKYTQRLQKYIKRLQKYTIKEKEIKRRKRGCFI